MSRDVFVQTTTIAGSSRQIGYSDWDLYRFGVSVGIRSLVVAPWDGLKCLLLPVEYVRCVETRYVLSHLDVRQDHTVLDVGSPKLLSLFLAARAGAQVYATDLLDYFFAAYELYAGRALRTTMARFRMETQDARALTYRSDTFDRAFSISAIEHIPGDGDQRALIEIARVLKPGGACCLTVPWSDTGYMEDFKRGGDPDAYWIDASEDKVFYQRAYDRKTLDVRLLRDSGLDLVDLSFWGERRVPVESVLLNRRIPRFLRRLAFPAHFPLSRVFLRQLEETEPSCKKVACLTLRKRGSAQRDT